MVLGSEGRIGILTEATVRVTPLPEQEEFHTIFFPDWDQAQDAVRAMVQAKVPLSMLRLANPVETLTTLTMAGHKSLIGALETYLGWRGCKEQKCSVDAGCQRPTGRCAPCAERGAPHCAASPGGGHRPGHGQEVERKPLSQRLPAQRACGSRVMPSTRWRPPATGRRVKPMMLALESAATHALAQDGEKVHTYTHLSHIYAQGASVYTTFAYSLAGDYAKDLARWRRLKTAVSEAIVANGGTISHQHGVGWTTRPIWRLKKVPRALLPCAACSTISTPVA
jgi:alkyldihydroxyacetonephosphate synthase